MEIETINLPTKEGLECVVGQGNFTVKTIDEFYTLLYSASKDIKFGVAMNEAKPKLVRVEGNDEELKKMAAEYCLKIGAGHVFVIFLREAYPIHVLNHLKHHPCVANIYLATSNPAQVLVAETDLGHSVVGVVDGLSAKAIESKEEREQRKQLVEKLGFVPTE